MSSCKQAEVPKGEYFKGEMFLKLIDIGTEIYTHSFNGEVTAKELFETVPELELTEDQIRWKKEYELLNKYDIIGKPNFNFAEEDSEIEFVKVYLNEKEYRKLKAINLSEIRDKGKKIKISFFGKRITEGVIKCHLIDKVSTVRGEQQWAK